MKYLTASLFSYFEDILIKYVEDNFSGDKRFYIINPHTNMGLTFAPWPRVAAWAMILYPDFLMTYYEEF